MNKEVLVLGGSIAGLQATLDLADAGFDVHLIHDSPFFDNFEATIPPPVQHARRLEALKHPKVHVRTNTRLMRVTGNAGDFQIALRQHPRYIDLTKCTACGECIQACPVTLPGSKHKAIYLDGQPGCMAIEKAGRSPCASTCPAGIHVQGYVALIAQRRFREAIDLIHEAMPFPSVCGRVCNHYCEAECTRGKVDEPVNIMALKRFVADWEYTHWERERNSRKIPDSSSKSYGKRVAIIGAGPAGLTAARDLNRLGHAVTVFDALPVPGGMMRVGIPAHRLPTELLDWEIQRIMDEGVEIILNRRVEDIPALFEQGYDAVLIATGAHISRKLPIPNADLPDNWLSLDVLRRASLGEAMDLGNKRVVVLGGGNVALDTARTVLRLGASQVSMACLEARGEMPGFKWEILVAEEEGIQIFPGRTFKEVVVKGGRVTGIHCTEVAFHGFRDGRPDMEEIPNTDHILPADIIIWAIGQAADLSFLPRDGHIRTRNPAGIQSDTDMMTSMTGVFVAGDVHRGVTFFVVDAIGEGHKVARNMDKYLRGNAERIEPVPLKKVEYSVEEIENKWRQASQQKRVQIASIPLDARRHNFREVDLTISEDQAITEAQRCLVCGPCCECQSCVQVCKAGAISHNQQETDAHLHVGAILCAVETESLEEGLLIDQQGFYCIAPRDVLSASAVAADILVQLGRPAQQTTQGVTPALGGEAPQIGIFLCECGGQISGTIDFKRLRNRLACLPGIVHTQALPFSCSPEAKDTIRLAVEMYRLDSVVLAACSCCSTDQACFSCTYQRLRCKQNLGLLPTADGHSPGLETVRIKLVNIREQCAWVHADHPRQATNKALLMLKVAAAGLMEDPRHPKMIQPVIRSALILGQGEAGTVCKDTLGRHGIHVARGRGTPTQIKRTGGRYVTVRGNQTWAGQALILAPKDAKEAECLRAAFGREALRPRLQTELDKLATHRPGIFWCDPTLAPELTGKAAAARAAAWLGRIRTRVVSVATIEPSRCRACGICMEVCEFGAPELIYEAPVRSAWIDPIVCAGCGACLAHCPTGAISLLNTESAELGTALAMALDPDK